jgi:signal transduction histidine kinase
LSSQISKTKPKHSFALKKSAPTDNHLNLTSDEPRRSSQQRTVSLLKTISELSLEPRISLKLSLEQLTQDIRALGNYSFVGIFIRTRRTEDQLSLYAYTANHTFNLPRNLLIRLDHPWFGSVDRGDLISIGEVIPLLNSFSNYQPEEAREQLRRLDLSSIYALKLNSRHYLKGLVVIGLTDDNSRLTGADRELLDDLLTPIESLIVHKQLMEENTSLRTQIKQLRDRLTALDEAKDDFISMASHQLRTPLTAIKGYVSMLREGDAGDVSSAQQDMLSQTYISCQKMVYVIADLLNVSRLKTGKFGIYPSPVQLDQIVSEEVDQMREIAKPKSINITYLSPKDFPELELDEIKIRQVVMNFIDNAIHYSHSGGKIEVNLTDKAETVELTVKDEGIGVPKSEQVHLFTKFYRAKNARVVRPDGMGLGLFMAKKVIIAEGGAIIFESHENRGSTFGFILSKAKLREQIITPAQ